MRDDLISRSELKAEILQALDRADLTDYEPSAVICDIYDRCIDNAPSVVINPFAIVNFDKDELNRIVDERVIEPIKNGELVVKREEGPKGEWVADDYAGIHCSECDYIPLKDVVIKIHADGTKEKGGNWNLTPYCPICGAYMKGDEVEDE